MGFGGYSLEAHKALTAARAKMSDGEVFRSGDCDPKMNPYGVKLRESRDSKEHPNSVGIVFALDVSGSMGEIPKQLATKTLPTFMDSVLTVLPDPQICFMALGNASSDRAPLQVGQFESEAKLIDRWLSSIWLEGGGGGLGESYDLAMYFAAHHTAMDCVEKRQKKGYFFMTGDEPPFYSLETRFTKSVIGDDVEKDILVHESVLALQKTFHAFFLIPDATRFDFEGTGSIWTSLLHERCITLATPEDTAIAAALLVGVQERALKTKDDVARQLESKMRRTGSERDRVVEAIAPFVEAIAKGDIAPPEELGLRTDVPPTNG